MERRHYKRWSKKYQVLVLADNRVLEGSTIDLSQNGIGLLLSSPPETKKELPMSVSLPVGRQELTAEFLWSKQQSNGTFQAGIRLISAPPEYINFTATMKYDIE